MKKLIVLAVALVIGASACGAEPEQAGDLTATKPPPTATPYPTYTVALTYTIPLPTTPVPSSTVKTHTVRAGETLGTIAWIYGTTVQDIAKANGIGNVNLLSVGQVLVIPESSYPAPPAGEAYPAPPTGEAMEPTSPPATTAPATLPSVAPGKVVVAPSCSQFNAPGNDNENLNQEYVCLENVGGLPVDMTNRRIVDEYGHTYTFPAFALSAGGRVLVHSGCGGNAATDLYWCREGSAVWNNDGDTVHLYDSTGELVDKHSY